VSEALASGAEHVVVTGGEPLIQREIGDLTRRLCDAGLHVTVETAGTAAPEFACNLLSVSPKTSNSDPSGRFSEHHRRQRSDPHILRTLLRRYPEHQIKFVVEGPGDLPEIVDLLARVGHRDRSRVLLMPEGRTAEEVARRAPRVAALCVEHGFRYTPRLHLDLFGGGRGV
jgi:7-carboxy-7-deazaguanine synthase